MIRGALGVEGPSGGRDRGGGDLVEGRRAEWGSRLGRVGAVGLGVEGPSGRRDRGGGDTVGGRRAEWGSRRGCGRHGGSRVTEWESRLG